MALPATGSISLGDIQTELGFSSASLAQFYDSSDLLGGGALMWHNVYGAVGTIFAGTINPQSSVSYPLTVANSVFVSSSYGGYTFVIQNLAALGSLNSVNCSVSAYDSDGAGPGQNRDAYNPPINPFDIFTSPQTFTCCEDATLSGKLIAINKRTTIEIVFSP